MPSQRKPKQQESVLRKLGRVGARPINSQAEVVAGVGRQNAKTKLRQQLKEVRAKIQATANPALREELQSEAKLLYARAQFGPSPRVDKRAVERAVRALEHAKWARENSRGRK
jgi:hypothetical protein